MAEERRQRPSRAGEGRSQGGKSQGGKPPGQSRGKPGSDRRPDRRQDRDWKRPADRQESRTEEQARYDGPDIPEEVTGKELDRAVAGQLKGLPEKLASRVARHLAAAGSADRRGPRDRLPAHVGRARPGVAAGRGPRGHG